MTSDLSDGETPQELTIEWVLAKVWKMERGGLRYVVLPADTPGRWYVGVGLPEGTGRFTTDGGIQSAREARAWTDRVANLPSRV